MSVPRPWSASALALACCLCGGLSALASTGGVTAAVNGQYHFAKAERGATGGQLELAQLGGKAVIAVAARRGEMPAIYTFQDADTKGAGVPVFRVRTVMLYLIQYDEDSFVLCQPDTIFGSKPWTSFSYFNFYTKQADKAKAADEAKLKAWAIELSKQPFAAASPGVAEE